MNITNELREKLLAEESAEKVTELVKADGQEMIEPERCGSGLAHRRLRCNRQCRQLV